MVNYVPPPGHDARGVMIDDQQGQGQGQRGTSRTRAPGYDAKGDAIVAPQSPKPRRGKPEKDPNAPKRNMSAYLLYQNAMLKQFKRENPGMTFVGCCVECMAVLVVQTVSRFFVAKLANTSLTVQESHSRREGCRKQGRRQTRRGTTKK